MDHQPVSNPPPAFRFVQGVFGVVFCGIGLSVIVFLWTAPFGEFGSPPLIFRLVGSLIAVAFVAMGGGTAFMAIKGVGPGQIVRGRRSGARNYECPRCGATLGDQADVSPSGDAKCGHCDSWFNIHAH